MRKTVPVRFSNRTQIVVVIKRETRSHIYSELKSRLKVSIYTYRGEFNRFIETLSPTARRVCHFCYCMENFIHKREQNKSPFQLNHKIKHPSHKGPSNRWSNVHQTSVSEVWISACPPSWRWDIMCVSDKQNATESKIKIQFYPLADAVTSARGAEMVQEMARASISHRARRPTPLQRAEWCKTDDKIWARLDWHYTKT